MAATQKYGLLKGTTIGVDVTGLEANAAMKSIVRRDNGDDWREYVRKLYEAKAGKADPDEEELRRFDNARQKREGLERRVGQQKRTPTPDRQDEGWQHIPEIQGRECGRPGDRSDRHGRAFQRWPSETTSPSPNALRNRL